MGKVALYSAVDALLTHYDVNVDTSALTRRETVETSSKVQYAWPHPLQKILYVSTSNGGPRVPSDLNHIAALAMDSDGKLHPHGPPRSLPRRAVHACVDPTGRYVLNAHNFQGGGVTVHRIEPDGTLGSEVAQDPALNAGVYPHQVMVFPSGRTALLVDRGNKAQGDKPEDPGALRTYRFSNGVLSAAQVVAPNGGFGFGPRHVSFHPTRRWMYVCDERVNCLYMFRYSEDDVLEDTPAWTLPILAEPDRVRPRQIAGPIHVHPSGKCVYIANRADGTTLHEGQSVFSGGENNIAVYAIDEQSGEPRLLQHADTQSYHVRTFACDPSGRLLVTASIKALAYREGQQVKTAPAALSVFKVNGDGRLDFVDQVPVDTAGSQLQYWMGMLNPSS